LQITYLQHFKQHKQSTLFIVYL